MTKIYLMMGLALMSLPMKSLAYIAVSPAQTEIWAEERFAQAQTTANLSVDALKDALHKLIVAADKIKADDQNSIANWVAQNNQNLQRVLAILEGKKQDLAGSVTTTATIDEVVNATAAILANNKTVAEKMTLVKEAHAYLDQLVPKKTKGKTSLQSPRRTP